MKRRLQRVNEAKESNWDTQNIYEPAEWHLILIQYLGGVGSSCIH
jgi:hypothetical protein